MKKILCTKYYYGVLLPGPLEHTFEKLSTAFDKKSIDNGAHL